jgi:hypothetical protein
MSKALSIKDTATYELVAELAAKTGASMTQAVNEAVRARLDTLERERLAKIDVWIEKIKANPLPSDFEISRDESRLVPRDGWA